MNLTTYRLLTHLGLPLFAYMSWKKCRKHKQAHQLNPELPEIPFCTRSRFGFNPSHFQTGGVLIHAVSVGETRSIFALLDAIKTEHPLLPITLTNSSIQGALHAYEFAPVAFQHQMLPFDYPFAVNRFLKQLKPKLVLMVETEIWPNLYLACQKQGIPVFLINARLKEHSFKSYQKWGGKMIRQALESADLIATQTQADANRFRQLSSGMANIQVFGNLKNDIEITPELLNMAQQWQEENKTADRAIWIAASTHANPNGGESEEALLLKAHQQLLKTQPNALLILVPRHQARFDEVATLLEQSGLNFERRSEKTNIDEGVQVYLADSLGEMMLWYAVANIAFVGGSLVPFGGHNILEPAALAKPIISGEHFANLTDMFAPFIEQNAIEIVSSEDGLANKLNELLSHPSLAENLAQKAHDCFSQKTGALEKTLAEINKKLR